MSSKKTAKKDGAGGKGTWGKDTEIPTRQPIDPKDPNYCSDDEQVQVPFIPVHVPKKSNPVFEDLISEFFSSGDLQETTKNLKETNFTSEDRPQFVKKLLTLALEKSPFERELTSQLLSETYSAVFSAQDIETGFMLTLGRLEDSVLDNPDAAQVVGKFAARAVVDEILSPSFVRDGNGENPLAKEALALAHGLTTDKYRTGRLEHVWGPGDLSSVKRLKEEVSLMLDEFLINHDFKEAEASVLKLNAPSFYFQVVKQAIRVALQGSDGDRERVHGLLNHFYKIGFFSSDTIKNGVKVCVDTVDDLALDVPDAKNLLEKFLEKAKAVGYLEN